MVFVAILVMLFVGRAVAGRHSTTFANVRFDLEVARPVTFRDVANGLVMWSPAMPSIWIRERTEPCPDNPRTIALPLPAGYEVADAPPSTLPWTEPSWEPLCIRGYQITLDVLVTHYDIDDPPANTFVQEVLHSIMRSVRPPIEPPGAVVAGTVKHEVLTLSAVTNGKMFGILCELWRLGRLSTVGQLEVLDSGDAADSGTDELVSFRFTAAAGLGMSRPNLRAGIHAGVGLDAVHMRVSRTDDRAGGSVFLDARALVSFGPAMVQGVVRGTRYFDLDCNTSDTNHDICGDIDLSDFVPQYGFDAELRVGYRPRGVYLGFRHFTTWARDRVEHNQLLTVGIVAW
jgi:hypothetical protein